MDMKSYQCCVLIKPLYMHVYEFIINAVFIVITFIPLYFYVHDFIVNTVSIVITFIPLYFYVY